MIKFARSTTIAFLALSGIFGVANTASAESAAITVILKDKGFTPAEVKIPVGKPVKVTFRNANASAAEIESKALGIEKDLGANADITVEVTAKEAGKFLFVDEFQEDVAKGYFVAE
jgi:plastocyanin domain-containing protein